MDGREGLRRERTEAGVGDRSGLQIEGTEVRFGYGDGWSAWSAGEGQRVGACSRQRREELQRQGTSGRKRPCSLNRVERGNLSWIGLYHRFASVSREKRATLVNAALGVGLAGLAGSFAPRTVSVKVGAAGTRSWICWNDLPGRYARKLQNVGHQEPAAGLSALLPVPGPGSPFGLGSLRGAIYPRGAGAIGPLGPLACSGGDPCDGGRSAIP
jgi:hypothetical protein